MRAVSLHHHTTFSFGDGYGTPAQHVDRAAELGYTAIAFTEHGNVSSHFQAEKAAIKAGIKPIFGLEAYCGSVLEENDEHRLVTRPDGEVELLPARSAYKNHLTLLAATARGYRNLNKIVARSFRDHYYHPTVSGRNLAANAGDIVALSGCSGSLLACSLLGGKGSPEHNDDPDFESAKGIIERFVRLFGDRYYLEVQPFYELPRTVAMNTAYGKLSRQTGVPLVVTFDVHYPKMEDAEMQAVLHAVHRGKASVDDAMREWNYEVPLTLQDSDKAIAERLKKTGLTGRQAWSAIETSAEIAERCTVTLPKAEKLRYPIEEKDIEPWQ
jgi:DNA polymerase III subunit alpha